MRTREGTELPRGGMKEHGTSGKPQRDQIDKNTDCVDKRVNFIEQNHTYLSHAFYGRLSITEAELSNCNNVHLAHKSDKYLLFKKSLPAPILES